MVEYGKSRQEKISEVAVVRQVDDHGRLAGVRLRGVRHVTLVGRVLKTSSMGLSESEWSDDSHGGWRLLQAT